MRLEPAGDFDYDAEDVGYAKVRQPEPAFVAAIARALGDAKTLVNVGAGAGSYEPTHLQVTPVEPSAAMRAARPPHLARAVDAVAEDLPFPDGHFDAALATSTVHQWRDLERGLAELVRVTRGPIVVLTSDPEAMGSYWLAEYGPEVVEAERGRMPSLDRLASGLGPSVEVRELPIPAGCRDGFTEAFFGRPEAFLDDAVRRAQSSWSFAGPEAEVRAVAKLATELADGSWDERHGALRRAPSYAGSLRLLVAGANRS